MISKEETEMEKIHKFIGGKNLESEYDEQGHKMYYASDIARLLYEHANQSTAALRREVEEKDEQLKYCHGRMADAYKRIEELEKENERLNVMAERLVENEVHFDGEIELLKDQLHSCESKLKGYEEYLTGNLIPLLQMSKMNTSLLELQTLLTKK